MSEIEEYDWQALALQWEQYETESEERWLQDLARWSAELDKAYQEGRIHVIDRS